MQYPIVLFDIVQINHAADLVSFYLVMGCALVGLVLTAFGLLRSR